MTTTGATATIAPIAGITGPMGRSFISDWGSRPIGTSGRAGTTASASALSHLAWCYDRWFTYRAWDNTYQPLYGPRRQCWSPFSG